MGKDDITIIMPEAASGDLVELTELLTKKVFGGEWQGGGALGGEYGYGVEFENDLFMMHPFCWRDDDACRWCGEEDAPNFLYKPIGGKVWWYKWIGRSERVEGKFDKDWLKKCKDSIVDAPDVQGNGTVQ